MTNINNIEISLELTQELKSIGIVTRFVYNSLRNVLIINLSDIYKNQIVILSVYSKDWLKFIDKVGKRLKQKGLENNHILLIQDVIEYNYKIFLIKEDTYNNFNDNNKNFQQPSSQIN